MHAINPALLPQPLNALASDILAALRKLTKEREPHHCGGFNIDDMRWQMGRFFVPDDEMYEAMDDLLTPGLIRFAGYDEESAYESCYRLC